MGFWSAVGADWWTLVRGGRPPVRVVLLVHTGLLSECLALIQDAERLLDQRRLFAHRRGSPDVTLGEPLQHAHPLHTDAGVDQAADEAGDREVSRRVAELAVLSGRADEALLLPVAQHPRGHAHPLGEPRDGHQLVVSLPVGILAATLADHAGAFRVLARLLVQERLTRPAALAAVLLFTALLSALVNLDVAVVVAMPVGLRMAERHELSAGWLAAAVAATANATSFLLPTSNVTNLLVLSRTSLPLAEYVRESALAWVLVTVVTVGALVALLSRRGSGEARPVTGRASAWAAVDLVPMFVAASAIRALLGTGITLRGAFVEQVAATSLLASSVNNLPAAAAVHPLGGTGLWAAILGMAIGPNLIVTGSVATLICRRIARDGGGRSTAFRFSILGLALVPLQLAVAFLGLRLVGAMR